MSIRIVMKSAIWCCLLMLASAANAQYQHTFKKGVYDLTANVKNGLNVWKTLPGNGVCKPGSGSMSYGGKLYFCIGTDGQFYQFSRETKVWSVPPGLAGVTGAVQIAVKNANAIYALWPSTSCHSPDMAIWFWNGSAWSLPGSGCVNHISVGGDGFLAATSKASVVPNFLWYSQDGAKTWTLWSTGYGYVHVWSARQGCAVSSNDGAVYTIALNEAANKVGGNFVGCVYGDEPFVMMAWDASGNVSMVDEQNGQWDPVAGLKASHIAATNKFMVLALDQSNKPYHWNVKARSITGYTTGSRTEGCPGPGNICNPYTQHKSTLKAWFASGHGINYSLPSSVQSILWSGTFSNSFTDVNAGCDPIFGNPTDPECVVAASGGEECMQSDATIGSVPNPPDPTKSGISHDYQTAVSYSNRFGPQLTFVSPDGLQYWEGSQELNMIDACLPDTFPTCPGPNPFGQLAISTGIGGQQNVLWELNNQWSLDNPYLSEESWDNGGVGGTVQCLDDQITWGTSGNFDDRNFVPTCD